MQFVIFEKINKCLFIPNCTVPLAPFSWGYRRFLVWNHEEIVSENRLRSYLSAPVWGTWQLIFGFEGFKTNSSDTPNTAVRVQVPDWFNERGAIEYQITGINVDFTIKQNFGSLRLKYDQMPALQFTTTGTLFYSPCLDHKITFSCSLLVKHFD